MSEEKKVVEIINSIIEKYKLSDLIKITHDEIKINYASKTIELKKHNKLCSQGPNIINPIRKFETYFNNLSICRKNDKNLFYSFKNFDVAVSTLKEGIQLTHLPYYFNDDPLELYEFIDIVRAEPEKFKEDKDKIYIFCFTKDYRKEQMWNKYGKNSVVIGFRFNKFQTDLDLSNIVEFRDVIYNVDNKYDFIREIQIVLKEQFGKTLIIDSFYNIARFFKRGKYAFEDEVRLCFDFNQYNLKQIFSNLIYPEMFKLNEFDLAKTFIEGNDEERKYLFTKLKNPIFEIQIEELICGKELDDERYEDIKKLGEEKGIKNIWKNL
jgi:hypothetical protein